MKLLAFGHGGSECGDTWRPRKNAPSLSLRDRSKKDHRNWDRIVAVEPPGTKVGSQRRDKCGLRTVTVEHRAISRSGIPWPRRGRSAFVFGLRQFISLSPCVHLVDRVRLPVYIPSHLSDSAPNTLPTLVGVVPHVLTQLPTFGTTPSPRPVFIRVPRSTQQRTLWRGVSEMGAKP